MTQERRIIARAARVPRLGAEFGVISMDVVRVATRADVPDEYLYGLFRYSAFSDTVKQHANGANVLHLSPNRIADYSFSLAPPLLRQEYSDIASANYELVDSLLVKNANLRVIRDFLLPKLVSGEIDPPGATLESPRDAL
jgi:type I restriction enzyme S subunit